jgi:[ribosomal protein S5]-alanine N-acetyltransferase
VPDTPSAQPSLRLVGVTPVEVEVLAAKPDLLRTARMLLRPLATSDREAFLAAARASRAELEPVMPLYQQDESDEAMFQRLLQLTEAAARRRAAPCVRLVGVLNDGSIAGGFNINAITRGLEWQAEVNWWIATPLTGRGLATEGVSALVRFALAELPQGLGLHVVHAWVMRNNPASVRVAERAGFQRQGQEKSYISTGRNWGLHDLYTMRLAEPAES